MPAANQLFEFNRDKAVEVIIYLAERIEDPSYYSIGKLLYFADKTSLERYGRFICGETYVAMKKGPVPSNVYDMLKEAVNNGTDGFVVEGDYYVKALRQANLDKLSDSDIESLDKVIEVFGGLPNWVKGEMSHDEAYHAAWDARGSKNSNPMNIESIANLLEDSEELIDYIHHKND